MGAGGIESGSDGLERTAVRKDSAAFGLSPPIFTTIITFWLWNHGRWFM
jgi:hypothetical protein